LSNYQITNVKGEKEEVRIK